MDTTTRAVVRTFALARRWEKYPGQIDTTYRRWFEEAFGNVGYHLWCRFSAEDADGWFANLDPENRQIFLTHPNFS